MYWGGNIYSCTDLQLALNEDMERIMPQPFKPREKTPSPPPYTFNRKHSAGPNTGPGRVQKQLIV